MILISTNGLAINHHFCADKLVKTGLFYKATPCGKKATKTSCCQKKEAPQKVEICKIEVINPCCNDKIIFLQVNTAFQLPSIDLKKVIPNFSIVPSIQFLFFPIKIAYTLPKYFNYKPPLIVQDDIEVEIAAFLC